MDVATLVSSVISPAAIAAGVGWLSSQLITHRLAKALEGYKLAWQSELEGEKARWQKGIEEAKAGWQKDLEKNKAEWAGEVHKEVQTYLGDKSAEREYALDARKRLYGAIGPLRFQLLMACRDVASRIENYGLNQKYAMSTEGYYGRSTLYRLLRPVAIADLIERQIAYADFSVDPTGVDLLRFKRIVFIAFTDGEPILNHPRTNWSHEREHLFSGTLSRIANALVIADEGVNTKERPMHFHEFEAFVQSPENLDRFSPLTEILDTFSIARKPVFWLRLVCFAFICNEYVATAGGSIGFARRPFDLPKLLLTSQDEHIRAHADEYAGIFRSMLNVDL